MAYSDYGGYAFRNGERVIERSDATITPQGDTFGTPGSWPGFVLAEAGVPTDSVMRITNDWPNGHVILGDGPLYVVLRKSRVRGVYRGQTKLESPSELLADHTVPRNVLVMVDGHEIEVHYLQEDEEQYVYTKLIQPDGAVWAGWSGYGVGAGLEGCEFGGSTEARNETLVRLWPEAIR